MGTTRTPSTKTETALPDNVLTWPVEGGGRIWPSEMTDTQLRKALAHGLRRSAQHFHDLGLEALADAAGGDGGMEYLADVQCDSYFEQAADRKALYKHMQTVPRYAAVMQEARGRVYARRVIEKAAARHTPS